MNTDRLFRAIVLGTIKLVALDPYAHWNFKPAAEDMWAFLSRFRRSVTTRALQVDAGR